MYRPTASDPWSLYNDYSSQAYATDVAADLQRQHYETEILRRNATLQFISGPRDSTRYRAGRCVFRTTLP